MSQISNQLTLIMKQKDQLQFQLNKLAIQLQNLNNSKHFDQGIIDNQGFPRHDLDFGEISNYRNLKRKQNQLNNNHYALMKSLQKKLFQLHSSYPQQTVELQNSVEKYNMLKKQSISSQKIQIIEQQSMSKPTINYLTPFIQVSLVEQYSPAHEGGLCVGDLISEFNKINIYTVDNMKKIVSQVRENHPIRLIILREMKNINQIFQKQSIHQKIITMKNQQNYLKIQTEITPKKWIGKGLLGCKIDPIIK